MKVTTLSDLAGTSRQVTCPHGGFVSNRFLLAEDGMGFTLTHTRIPQGNPQFWHYKHHMEACYCISGRGILIEWETLKEHIIEPGMMYALDANDAHTFQAIEDTVLVCVFSPPLQGTETHRVDGSYAQGGQ